MATILQSAPDRRNEKSAQAFRTISEVATELGEHLGRDAGPVRDARARRLGLAGPAGEGGAVAAGEAVGGPGRARGRHAQRGSRSRAGAGSVSGGAMAGAGSGNSADGSLGSTGSSPPRTRPSKRSLAWICSARR